MIRRATFLMRSGFPTEVPPYFWTMRAMRGRDFGAGFFVVKRPPRCSLPAEQFEDRAHLGLRWNHAAALLARDVGIFQTVAGNGADDRAFRGDARRALEQSGDGCRARRFDENAFLAREPAL